MELRARFKSHPGATLVAREKENEELKRQIAELTEEIAFTRLVREQMEKIAEGVKKWQTEKREIEARSLALRTSKKWFQTNQMTRS